MLINPVIAGGKKYCTYILYLCEALKISSIVYLHGGPDTVAWREHPDYADNIFEGIVYLL